MQYCLSRKPEEYEVTYNGNSDGLWLRYGHDPSLFNLLSLTSTSFFMYEQGFETLDQGKLIVALDNIDAWVDTLDSVISKKTVRELLEELTPRQFTDLILEVNPRKLPIYEILVTIQHPKRHPRQP